MSGWGRGPKGAEGPMTLSAAEQYMLELVNRARLDPLAEAARLGIGLNDGLAPGTLDGAPKRPLAPNALLDSAAHGHSVWMMQADTFSHTGAGGSTPWDRMAAAGYDWWRAGENIALYRVLPGPVDGDAAMALHHDGLFDSPGHRENILAEGFRELGIGQHIGTYATDGRDWSTSIVTQKFGSSGNDIFLTGVAHADHDGDGFYTIGEGAGGLSVAAGGASTLTAPAGGYKLALAAGTGWLDVALAGGAMQVRIDMGGGNAKLDVTDPAARHVAASADLVLVSGVAAATLLGAGDLSLTGGVAGERLTGNRGDNRIEGGAGDDTLAGGDGADTFVVTPGGGADVLADFVLGTDRLDLSEMGVGPLAVAVGGGPGGATLAFAGGETLTFAGLSPATLSDPATLAALGLTLAAPEPPEVARPLPDFLSLAGDVANVAGHADSFVLSWSPAGLAIAPHAAPESQHDLPVDTIRFSDGGPFGAGEIDFDAFVGRAGLDTDDLSLFVEMYVAYFDRAPDALGLAFWSTHWANGVPLREIASAWFNQAETRAAFPDPADTAALVDAAYRNLLERDADPGGRAWWIDQLDRGLVDRAEFMLALIGGARANDGAARDVRTIEAKAALGLDYAAQEGLTDPDNARTVMAAYTATDHEASLAAARALIDSYAEAARSSEGGTELLVFFDTPGAEFA